MSKSVLLRSLGSPQKKDNHFLPSYEEELKLFVGKGIRAIESNQCDYVRLRCYNKKEMQLVEDLIPSAIRDKFFITSLVFEGKED